MAQEPQHRFKKDSNRVDYNRIKNRITSRITSDDLARDGGSEGKKRVSKAFLITGLILIAVALIMTAFLLFRYYTADKINQTITRVAGVDLRDTITADSDPNAIDIDWTALKAVNPDIVGWVIIPDTKISYPIVQTTDNDFYLTHLSDKSRSANGAIFLDYQGDPKIHGKSNMIYGHNMLDGSMFAALKDYRNADFYNSHKTILILTPEKNYKLEAVSVLICDAEDKIRQVSFESDEAYIAYVKLLLGYAESGELTEDNIPSNIFAFATCTDFNNSKRFVVLAKEV